MLRHTVRDQGPLMLLVALGACEAPASERALEAVFPETKRVVLQEDVTDPIAGITALSVSSQGDLIVTDLAASKVRVFGPDGSLLRTLGGPGEGPGELDGPNWAAAGPNGEIRVVERGSPRVTTYWPNDSATVERLPGHYGFWIAPTSNAWTVGAATRTTRFATLGSEEDQTGAAFGVPPDRVATTPFWVFFAKDRGVVLGDEVWTNSSMTPELSAFSLHGELLRNAALRSERWIEPTPPPIDRIEHPGDRERIEAWSRTFTVVTALAAMGDSVVVVQYGVHDPAPQEPYRTMPQWIDVYGRSGALLDSGLIATRRLLAGGRQLYFLEAEPPEPWTITIH